MNIADAIAILNKEIINPQVGLPDEVFYFISSITPLVNVDLLIKDEKGRMLLGWRDDKYAGQGWHILGGIVRFKESLETRVRRVAESEIGAKIKFDSVPIAINQVISKDYEIRGHFISILYKCFLPATFVPKNKNLKETDAGFLKWHDTCPDNLLKLHNIYRKFL